MMSHFTARGALNFTATSVVLVPSDRDAERFLQMYFNLDEAAVSCEIRKSALPDFMDAAYTIGMRVVEE